MKGKDKASVFKYAYIRERMREHMSVACTRMTLSSIQSLRMFLGQQHYLALNIVTK
jgi:hypothetical protein